MAEQYNQYLARGSPPFGRARKWIGGNWKCNNTLAQVNSLVTALNNAGSFPLTSEVVIAVPNLHLLSAKSAIRNDVEIAAQDVGLNAGFGAYTGETSAQQLVDAGVKWTLTGHSERRVGFGYPGETSDVVGKKTAVALAAGMSVAVCIGEQLAERENGTTMVVCSEQLAAVTKYLKEADWSRIVIAYEPVWAIGTGKVATPEQAEQTHLEIRQWVATNVSPAVAADVRIVYGGSVNGANCKTMIACPNIDGFLVGGASLKPEFVDIIKCSA